MSKNCKLPWWTFRLDATQNLGYYLVHLTSKPWVYLRKNTHFVAYRLLPLSING